MPGRCHRLSHFRIAPLFHQIRRHPTSVTAISQLPADAVASSHLPTSATGISQLPADAVASSHLPTSVTTISQFPPPKRWSVNSPPLYRPVAFLQDGGVNLQVEH